MKKSGRARLLALLFFGIPAITVVLLFAFIGGRMDGDGQNYYIYLRSIVFDGDLDLHNDYEMFPRDDPLLARVYICSKGRSPNIFSVGPAILWAPFFLVARGVSAVLPDDYVGNTNDGKGEPYYFAIGIASVLASLLGIAIVFRFLREQMGIGPAALGTLGVWLAGAALHYQIFEPYMSHSLSLFAVSLFIIKSVRVGDFQKRSDWIWLGALAGLMALIRWQNLVFVIVPAALILFARYLPRTGEEKRKLPIWGIGIGTLTALIAFTPQMIVWKMLFGEFLVVPQGNGFLNLTDPHIIDMLFSTRNGMLLWAPVLGLAIIGLVRAAIQRDRLGIAMLVAFSAQLFLNASVMDWWAGDAFGGRRFVGCFPIFAFGLARLVSDRGKKATNVTTVSKARMWGLAVVIAALVFSNTMLMTRYVTGQIPKDGSFTVGELATTQLQMAGDWLHWLLTVPGATRTAYGLGVSSEVARDARELHPTVISERLQIDIGAGSENAVLSDGWHGRERWEDTSFRWSKERSAVVFQAMTPEPAQLTLRARARRSGVGNEIEAILNGKSLGLTSLPDDWTEMTVRCPIGLLKKGLNALELVGPAAIPDQVAPEGGFVIPYSNVHFAGNLILRSKDTSGGLASEIILNGTDVSPNEFGLNIAAIDPKDAQVVQVEVLPFGAKEAEQRRIAGMLAGIDASLVVVVSSRSFGVSRMPKSLLIDMMSRLSDLHGKNYLAGSGIGGIRVFRKVGHKENRMVGELSSSDPGFVRKIEAALAPIQDDMLFLVTLGEDEAPLLGELVAAFDAVGIDITIPHKFRVPFVAFGGKFLAKKPAIKRTVERGVATLRFGRFPDPRELSFAVDRITLERVKHGE
ncbi:hypothetical protein J7M28_03475 [bacterium]|nr:hypothetical protein [bacterium]